MNGSFIDVEVGRKNPATGVLVHIGQRNIVFPTVTTKSRTPWLTNPEAHQFLRETWFAATAWLVGDYLLMPDHIHLFCAPRDLAFTVEKWITFWKRDFRRRHKHNEWLFQSRGWHRRLREDEDYPKKWLYVQENPVRKELAKSTEEWPFKGTIHHLTW